KGSARSILTAERTILNFMGPLSGVATLTRQFVDAVDGTNARIVCTRKTTPGHRALEKRAVRLGGAVNHRFGLDDAILIKDNHIAAAGGITAVLTRAKASVGHLRAIEIEVDTLDQLSEALPLLPDAVLLDNMPPDVLREAVAMIDGRCKAEASGGVNLDTVRAIAETGVDFISVGALTHSAINLDLGLDYGA
ncbi:MAG: carboxylating nicotinate-nucleotide diphosphorylase, partial [Pseudomonadota bacterium]